MTFPDDPAFGPSEIDGKYEWHHALTKREYFAVEMMKKSLDEMLMRPNFDLRKFNPETAAKNALVLADALIKELSQ